MNDERGPIPDVDNQTLGAFIIDAIDRSIELIACDNNSFKSAFALAGYQSMTVEFTRELARRARAEHLAQTYLRGDNQGRTKRVVS